MRIIGARSVTVNNDFLGVNMKKVSIVVCCYNVADVIERCWNSIKNQTIGIDNLECIFVDDASTDDGATWEKLCGIEKDSPENVMIIASEKNGGPGGALNVGISYASGKYLQLMGADDEFVPEAMESLYRIAEENKTDIIQYNHTLLLGDQSRVNKVSVGNLLVEIKSHEDRVGFLNATRVTYGCTNKFYKTDLVKDAKVKFAENVVYEEPLFVYPLFFYAKRVYFCEEGFYLYHLHEGSVVTSRIGRQLLDHPKVQLMLLSDCMERGEVYEEYKDVIACYFLWTYYCETILFTGEHMDAHLPISYFSEMQKVCLQLYPNWKDNPYVRMVSKDSWELFGSMERTFSSQKDLDEYIEEVGKNFK